MGLKHRESQWRRYRVAYVSLDPLVGAIAAYSTFVVGYISRALGGIVFGHCGDRIGQKTMLILAMLIVGAETVDMSLLPTCSAIGIGR